MMASKTRASSVSAERSPFRVVSGRTSFGPLAVGKLCPFAKGGSCHGDVYCSSWDVMLHNIHYFTGFYSVGFENEAQ